MRLLIDIGHPAHLHYWRNFANIMSEKGNIILFTARDKEITIELLNHYQFTYQNLGKPYKGFKNKVKGLITFNYKLLKISRKFKPDIFLSAGSPYAAIVSSLLGKPHITIEDTFNFEQIRIYLPFTKVVLTGNYNHPSLGKKEIRYNGYQELAYLHPNYFKPEKNIINDLVIKENEKYVLLRFVSWQASHDFGHNGMSLINKINAVQEFGKYAKVFISSEGELPDELNKYKLKIAPHNMHSVLAHSSLLFGESGTMTVENAILGNPSIFISNKSHFLQKDIADKYNLIFMYLDSEKDQVMAIEKGIELLTKNNGKEIWEKRQHKLIADKIDFTAFLIWFVENYPNSFAILKENPDYQYNFR